jgi:1-acyl-sn-glycerol-3-phosphate acyltransferase
MTSIWKFFLSIIGWKTDLVFPYHHLKKYIVLVGPHTSNWDFIIGVAYRHILGMDTARFLGKKELFRPPFGFIFHWLGGTPVDRSGSHNVVDEVAELFAKHERFALALSPEGTRKRVERLRTGFYFIARKANVPIILVGLDYQRKQCIFSEPLYTTPSQEDDFARVLSFYRTIKGKVPENGMMHL